MGVLFEIMSINRNFNKSYLFVLPWTLDSLGGVNQVVGNLFFQIKSDDKYNPMVIVNSWNDTKIRMQSIEGIDHYFFRLRSPWHASKKLYNFMMFVIETCSKSWRFLKFINLNKVVVINVHYCGLSALNFVLYKFFGLFNGCLVLSFHGKDLLNAKQSRGLEKKLWKLMLQYSDTIVTCSESLKNELVALDTSFKDKTVVIHNGIDLRLFQKNFGRQSDYDFKDQKIILNVATLEHKKGQDVLLKAFSKIADRFPDVSLVIIGRPGGAENQIKQLIKTLDLSHRVQLYEGLSHDKVLVIMEKAMIFVLPSRYEPFGIVILEAGAFGVPVIASNVGGIGEILTHNETGRLCDSEDVNAFAMEMSNLLKETEERKRLGKNLRKHVIKNFSWNRTYQNYLKNIVCVAGD